MSTKKISPTKISPTIFIQKMFTQKISPQKKCSLKKCSPNKFSPKKIFTQTNFRTKFFFTESVRLSFVDLRWAQLYVSLVSVHHHPLRIDPFWRQKPTQKCKHPTSSILKRTTLKTGFSLLFQSWPQVELNGDHFLPRLNILSSPSSKVPRVRTFGFAWNAAASSPWDDLSEGDPT